MLALLPKLIVFLGTLFMFFGLFKPTILVGSYLIFRPLIQPFSWLQYKLFGFPIALPFALIVIVLGLVFPLIKNRWHISVEKSGAFIAFIFIAFMSAGFSQYFSESAAALTKLLTVWFLYNIAYNSVETEKDAVLIIDALIISSVIPLMFGFYQEFTGNYDIIYDAEVNRISSVFATGNDYGIYLSLLTAATAIRLFTATTRKTQIILMIMISMILVSQVLSLNRGTWLALTMGLIVATAKYRRYINFKILIIGGIAFLLLSSGKIIQRFQELQDPSTVHYSGTNTLEGRLAHWNALIPVIKERPFRGHGIGSSSTVIQKHIGEQLKVHNDYILVALEIGIFGALAYIIFLLRIFTYFFLRRRSRDLWIWNFSMLMLIVYFIVISATQNIVQSIMNFPTFLILVAVVFKLNRLSETDSYTENTKTQAVNTTGKNSILRSRVVH